LSKEVEDINKLNNHLRITIKSVQYITVLLLVVKKHCTCYFFTIIKNKKKIINNIFIIIIIKLNNFYNFIENIFYLL